MNILLSERKVTRYNGVPLACFTVTDFVSVVLYMLLTLFGLVAVGRAKTCLMMKTNEWKS
jgi:hypothetical protein